MQLDVCIAVCMAGCIAGIWQGAVQVEKCVELLQIASSEANVAQAKRSRTRCAYLQEEDVCALHTRVEDLRG